jgi:hypothetical protein
MNNTGEKFTAALKTFAKVGGAVMLQIVLFTAVGIVLNLIFIPFLIPEMKTLTPSGSNPGARAGGAAVVLIIILYLLPTIGVLALFLVLMPLIFFFVGKKQGIKAGLSKLIHEKGDNMVGFIVGKFTDRMANNPEWKESMQKNGVVVTVRKFFPGFIKTLQGLPWILKRPLKIVFEGIDFAGAVEAAYATRPDSPINSPETNAHITETISSKLKLKFSPPKGRLLLILVGINIIVFIIVKIAI